MARSSTFLPMLVVIIALALFAAMDGLMKSASTANGAYGAMFWRAAVGTAFMLPLWLWRGKGLPRRQALRIHVLRSAVAGAMAFLFFWGLVRTPMAEAMALSFIAPLIALYLASVWLGEPVAPRAIAGSLLALAGVAAIALRKFGADSDARSVEGLAAILVSAVLYAWNLVLQRRQAQLAGPEEVAFFQTLFILAMLAPGAWWLAPVPVAGSWWSIGGAAALSAGSIMLLSWAYARAQAQVLVPLEYTAFIWAAVVGWFAFAEKPGVHVFAGTALIIAGCLVATRRALPKPRSAAEQALE